MYKIAIAGASTLLGRELKDALSESPLAAANFALLDEEEAQGQLDQVGDEVTFVQAISADAFEHVDFTFFCGTERPDAQALAAGAARGIDGARSFRRARPGNRSAGARSLAGSGGGSRRSCSRPPWFRRILLRWPWRCCSSGSAGRAGAVCRGHGAGAGQRVWPRRHGRAAPADGEPAELSDAAARDIYDAQVAYNLLGGLGENAKVNLSATGGADSPPLRGAGGRALAGSGLAGIHAPVFHGHTFSIAVELERPVEIAALEEALSGEHVDLVLEDTDSPSNLAATGQNDVLVRLRPEPVTAQCERDRRAVAVGGIRQSAALCAECGGVRAGPAHGCGRRERCNSQLDCR